ncbi:MAG: DUF3795 domain-containing protein [Anaerofustis sp.]
MGPNLIAPCGLNCSACIAHLREKNVCFGCNIENGYKSKTMAACIIKNCEKRKALGLSQCSSACESFPCKRLKELAKRYARKYDVDLFSNLQRIETEGAEQFAAEDELHWLCPVCGAHLSMHRDSCISCETPYR